MNDLSIQRADEIRKLHNEIGSMMQKSLANAIRLGELLTLQKAELKHGYFITWITAYLPFDRTTAFRYMRLFTYRAELKSCSVQHLIDAYKRVEQLEYKARQEKQKTQQKHISQYENTGNKPEGWDRSTDYELRKKEAFSQKKQRAETRREQPIQDEEINTILKQTDALIERQKKQAHLRLNTFADNLSQEAVFQAIEIYINNFESVSQQLEATHNLVKKLRLIANELQKESVA